MCDIAIRNVGQSDLDEISALELSCFPLEEAATKESFKRRINTFPESFFVAETNGKIVGVVNGCVTNSPVIFDEMYHDDKTHIKDGENQVVFGLLVHPDYQRKGIAEKLLNHMITASKKRGKKAVILTCKDKLIHYYAKFGFENMGVSGSTHGGAVWYDMLLKLK
ncbi:MAG: GNAT family N-acetyltransferase [Sedimentibacter sp.]